MYCPYINNAFLKFDYFYDRNIFIISNSLIILTIFYYSISVTNKASPKY